jgi:hypothetical protein
MSCPLLPSCSSSAVFLHSTFMLGPLLVTFAGCQGHASDQDCFSRDLLLYNTLCDTWDMVELPGLPANASRYGHTLLDPQGTGSAVVFGGFAGTLHSDILRLVVGNCSQWTEFADCVNASSMLCAWNSEERVCVSVGSMSTQAANISFPTCDVSPSTVGRSRAGAPCPPSPPAIPCSNYSSCQDCTLYGCYWGSSNDRSAPRCFSETDLEGESIAGFCVETSLGSGRS